MISYGVHVQFGPPPHGHGFMAATSMNLAGNVTLILALDTVTTPSSMGCLKASRTSLLNSGNSSMKSTPLWASETSPGFGNVPPPIIDTGDAV